MSTLYTVPVSDVSFSASNLINVGSTHLRPPYGMYWNITHQYKLLSEINKNLLVIIIIFQFFIFLLFVFYNLQSSYISHVSGLFLSKSAVFNLFAFAYHTLACIGLLRIPINYISIIIIYYLC